MTAMDPGGSRMESDIVASVKWFDLVVEQLSQLFVPL